jgi:hypothetical protein
VNKIWEHPVLQAAFELLAQIASDIIFNVKKPGLCFEIISFSAILCLLITSIISRKITELELPLLPL